MNTSPSCTLPLVRPYYNPCITTTLIANPSINFSIYVVLLHYHELLTRNEGCPYWLLLSLTSENLSRYFHINCLARGPQLGIHAHQFSDRLGSVPDGWGGGVGGWCPLGSGRMQVVRLHSTFYFVTKEVYLDNLTSYLPTSLVDQHPYYY